jgi:hypothetical protein
MKAAAANNFNGAPSSRVWEVINHLETKGLSTSNNNPATSQNDDGHNHNNAMMTIPITTTPQREQRLNNLTREVALILREWGERWAGQPEWQTLLNKKSLLHEVEESIVALSFLLDWLEMRESGSKDYTNNAHMPPVTLVDVCCGKGILSMLASYVFRNSSSIAGIIMLDKQIDINWNHIYASNENAKQEGRPIIITWSGCNVNEIDTLLDRLEREQETNNSQYALIGIHLCKLLSPSCAGLANALGHDKCPFLCLAPCCLPRAVLQGKHGLRSTTSASTVSIRTFETSDKRQARHQANAKRAGAKKRSFRDQPCYLCSNTGHPVNKCVLLPSRESEQLDIFQKAAAQIPWYV